MYAFREHVTKFTTALNTMIQMWRMGNAGDGAGAPDEMDNLRSSRGETVC